MALGLTNLMVRRFVGKGWLRVTHVKPHRVRYLITPAGLAEKARLSQQAFQNSVLRYRVARTRIQDAFAQLSAGWPAGASPKRIVFYGTGEIAEIGFVSLQDTDLELVAVIDDCGRTKFFGVPVVQIGSLPQGLPAAASGARVVVMSLARTDEIRATLDQVFEPAQTLWI